MSSAPTDPTIGDASAAPSAIPRDSSPTWELEMLVSGAVTFSLFQFPPMLDRLFEHWHPHATEATGTAMVAAYMVVKGGLYTLIAAFVVHLCVRAYWVGLIGLNSVFPEGVRWDRVLMVGPTLREVLRERMPTLPAVIARLDNFASVIFSFAFMIVLVMGITLPLALLAGLATYGIAAVAFGGRHVGWIAGTIFLLLMLPALAIMYDLKRGARLPPGSPAARRLRRMIGVVYHTQLIGVTGPVLYTIGSSARRRTAYAAFYAVLIGSFAVVFAEVIARSGIFTMGGARYFSTSSDANSLHFAYYESAWGEDHVEDRAPSIQDDVITGPYVRLFIPYRLTRDDAAVAAVCPRTPPLTRGGIGVTGFDAQSPAADSAAASVLRCLAAMHAVRVDGQRVSDLRFRFTHHPRSGIDGIVAYVPTATLPRGEHVLTVMPVPRVRGPGAGAPLEPYVIPFWY